MTKFCKTCQELVYSSFCIHCGKEPGALEADDTTSDDNSIIVNEDGGRWGEGAQGMSVVSFDEVFGSSSDD